MSVKAVRHIDRDSPVDSIVSSTKFVDDFSRPSDAWRFGNAKLTDSKGLMFNERQPEATLAGTTVHPDNLREFTAKLRWSYSKKGQPLFLVGWGKPCEWSSIDECLIHLSVSRGGLVTVMAGKQVLGDTQLTVPTDTVYELTITQESQRLVLRSDRGELGFSLPAGSGSRPGYFMLAELGLTRQQSGESIKMHRVEISYLGQHLPMTEVERNRGIQEWTKEHLDANHAVLERFKTYIEAETLAGRWGYKTDMTVQPGLVKPGEKVTIEFHRNHPVPSQGTAFVEPDFLSASPGKTMPVKFDWKSDHKGGYVATMVLTPMQPGNWRVVWQVGKVQLTRVFAVVGPGYLVARLLFTNYKGPWTAGHQPGAYDLTHEYGIASDYWSGDEWTSPFGRTPEALLTRFGFFSRNRHLWGDRVMPMVNANWLFPGCPDANLFRFDDEVQREGIEQISSLWNMMGLGPMEIMATYTLGNNTPRIARELGVKMLDSFCQWQNWRDGGSDNHWLINHVGAPALPYYVADDDFRKIAAGQSILAFTQNTNSNVRLYDIMTAEGQPQLNFRRTHGNDMAESSNIDRFETTVDLWLKEALYQSEPLIVSVGLENFMDSRDWDEANKRGVRYLREQAMNRKLVFTSSADIAGYFERHYTKQPENWIVWPDVYAGQAGAYKPRLLPDRIELSNSRFHTLHEYGKVLPEYFWDYTRPWSEPVWDDQKDIRLKFGLVDPQLNTPDKSVPRMVNLEGVRARIDQKPINGGMELSVTIYTPKPIGSLPVAAWNIPLEPDSLIPSFISADARFIPVLDGSTGNVHGVVICSNVPVGTSTWTVRLKGRPRKTINPNLSVQGYVTGRMFMHQEVPRVYLWLAEPTTPNGVLKIMLPAGRKANVHYNDGRIEEDTNGTLQITLDRTWQRESPLVTGLTALELQTLATFEPVK
jgi:hypothetical protein